jgi:steroid delta-isomerase-like uncharacterized protein
MNIRYLAALVSALMLFGCARAPTDYAAEMKPALDAFVEAWNTGDVDKLDASTTEDFMRTSPAGMEADSREAMKGVMTALRASYPDARVVITDTRYDADRAFLNWTFTGTNTGPGDMPPTGKPVQLSGYTVTHFDGDKIAHEEVYFDVLSWMTQLGATLTPPGSDAVKQAAIEAFVEAWNTGDVDKLDASTTEDFMRTSPAGMEADSREAMKGVITALRTSYPDARVAITDSHYGADRAFLNWTFTGTNTGPGDMPPTDNPVQLNGYTVTHFDGDRIAHEEVYFDVLSWMTQLGATLTPPGG